MLHRMRHSPRPVRRPPSLALSLLFTWLLAIAGPAGGGGGAAAQTTASLLPPAAHFGGPLTALAPTGDLVWLAQGRRVWAVDLADPARSRDRGPGLSLPWEVAALAAALSPGPGCHTWASPCCSTTDTSLPVGRAP